MKWFVNLKTRNKLSIGFGLMCTFLIAVILSAMFALVSIKTAQRNLYQREFANTRDLLILRSNLNGIHASLLGMIAENNRSKLDYWLEDIRQRGERIADVTSQLQKRNRDDALLLGRIDELYSLGEAFVLSRENKIIQMIYSGQTDAAKSLIFGIQDERKRKMRVLAKELGNVAINNAETAMLESEGRMNRSLGFIIAIGLVSILLGLVLVQVLNKLITVPLVNASAIASQIATGDLTVRIPEQRRNDEVGMLLKAFAEIGTLLKNLRQLMQNISEAANLLSTSSAEILATTSQVASAASETASAVSETTATVEQVKQTVQVTSQKAKLVSERAQKSTEASTTGRKSVDNVIEGMRLIERQMESIADSIVRLSEQSQAISEIIATVNELAEQSNLLAVNAAIEASKVSEQGKGFAVVAQEIKSLADQSKQATSQVRLILGDIQKATNTTVLATEQGNKCVQAGVSQSVETGQAIRQLAKNIDDAALAATQIAASSQQQMVGMEQVALAMENIKQASAQNMSGTKQAETAAHNLHELGIKLQQLVSGYKI